MILFLMGGNMEIHSKEIADKILIDNLLYVKTLPLPDLFCIRDHCLGLARYGLEDRDLLQETLKYLGERVGE